MATLEDVKEKAPSTEGGAYLQRVEQAGKFLSKYGVNISELTNAEIISKAENILALSQSAAQVLSKGLVLDGLSHLLEAHVPKGFRGEFMRERDLDIHRAEAMGWKIFIDESKKDVKSPTGAADGRVRLGDLVLMITPEDNYVARQIARENRKKVRREGRDPKKAGPAQGDEFMQSELPIVNV